MSLEEKERSYIQEVLEFTNEKIACPNGATALLEIPPSTLRSKNEKIRDCQIGHHFRILRPDFKQKFFLNSGKIALQVLLRYKIRCYSCQTICN